MGNNEVEQAPDVPVPEIRLAIGIESDDIKTQIITEQGWHVCYIEHDPHQEIAQHISHAVNNYAECIRLLEWVTRAPKVNYHVNSFARCLSDNILDEIRALVESAPAEYKYDYYKNRLRFKEESKEE